MVYGIFEDDKMQDFSPDLRHRSSHRNAVAGGFYPNAPIWLRNTLLDHRQQQYLARQAADAARAEQYQRDHPSVPSARTYARPNDPTPTYQPTQHEVLCYSCGGHGWVDGTDGLGHARRDQCGKCGGGGKIMSKY